MNTIARIKKLGKHFEIIVDLDEAIELKEGKRDYIEAEGDKIFKDVKKGELAPDSLLLEAFKTKDPNEIAKIIVKEGEILTNQEYRNEKKENKIKQIIELISKNAIDPQTQIPITSERIKNAIEQSHINIKDEPIEAQLNDIIKKISEVIPIKIKFKKIKVTIPSIYTGKSYGLIKKYEEKENWLNDGSLEVILNVPSGILLDFYDKLNSITKGSVITEEIEE